MWPLCGAFSFSEYDFHVVDVGIVRGSPVARFLGVGHKSTSVSNGALRHLSVDCNDVEAVHQRIVGLARGDCIQSPTVPTRTRKPIDKELVYARSWFCKQHWACR